MGGRKIQARVLPRKRPNNVRNAHHKRAQENPIFVAQHNIVPVAKCCKCENGFCSNVR